MRSPYETCLWFLLVPYFAVRSLNVPPWFGSRENANRTNAQLAVALIFASAILGILGATGSAQTFGNIRPIWLGLLCIVPPMIAVSLLLNREREQRYEAAYEIMPSQERTMFGVAALAFVSLMWWLFLRSPA